MAGSVLFAGATGLIGSLALSPLLRRAESAHFTVYAPTRRAVDLRHPRLHNLVVDLASPSALQQLQKQLPKAALQGGSFVCALGTTLRAAGSAAAFAAIDRDLVLALAAIARSHGARQAVLVSSVGAQSTAPSFYLRTKAAVESGVEALGFERCDFLQPSLLLGTRSEARPAERIAQHLAPLYNPFLFGPLRAYRAISAHTVAAAMVSLTGASGNGVWRHRHDSIEAAAKAAN